MSSSRRKIIHCDADCFFAAIEMRDDTSLKGIPLAVGGDPSKRGVVSTCNYEARAFGVHSAMASAYAKKLCPQLIIVPHSMAKYRVAAQQLKSIFSDYTDLVEPLSLDEAFMDVSDSDSYCGSATLIAKEIRRRVEREVGITVSAGISSNKFLAKVASDWDKPNGLTVIEPSRIVSFMKGLPIKYIPGVGKKTQAKLQNLGIFTCSDILPLEKMLLTQHFGKFGVRLYQLARGEDNRLVEPSRDRKSVSIEKTVDQDILPGDSQPLLAELYHGLQERILHLPKSKQLFFKVFVKIKFSDFSKTTIETTTQKLLLDVCEQLFDEAWQRHQKPIRLIGIGVRLLPESHRAERGKCQLDLFASMLLDKK